MAKRPLLDNLIRRLSIDSGEKKRPAEDNEILLEREGPLFWGTFWLITSTEMFYVFLSVGWSHCACRSKAYPRPCLQHSAGRICGVDDAVGEYCYSVLIFGLLSAPRFVCFALVSPQSSNYDQIGPAEDIRSSSRKCGMHSVPMSPRAFRFLFCSVVLEATIFGSFLAFLFITPLPPELNRLIT